MMSIAPNADQLRNEWLGRLAGLIQQVQSWAEAVGWSTRRIQVTLKDSQIGRYEAPALLLQEGALRLLLEPIARSAPGVQGVVDLYSMPAYDDVASLYYEDAGWSVRYLSPAAPADAALCEADVKPLAQETLRGVLEEMKQHAV